MLTNVTLKNEPDAISSVIAVVNGRSPGARRISDGFYECGHWSFERDVVDRVEPYPELSRPIDSKDVWYCPYGVCDGPEQFARTTTGRMVAESPRRFVVSFVRIVRSDEPSEGGWRWHKWGPYIGEKEPKCEYLHDEPEISEVWTYHVYEVLS